MAQAFVTTHRDHFRTNKIVKTKSLRPVDKVAETLPEGDIWIIPKKIGEDEEGGHGLTAAREAVNAMYRKRLYSTYQVSYCKNLLPPAPKIMIGEEGESTLMIMCQELYKSKTQKIPPPLPSWRRISGYFRPSNMYVPLTVTQHLYGKVGYDIMLNNRKKADPCAPEEKPKFEIKICNKKSPQGLEDKQSNNNRGECIKERMKFHNVKGCPNAQPRKLKVSFV